MGDYLDIPAFLKISQEDRKKAWGGVILTDSHTGGLPDEHRVREEERRHAVAEKQKAKNAAAFVRMKAKHPGQVYDRSMKQWVPETKGE